MSNFPKQSKILKNKIRSQYVVKINKAEARKPKQSLLQTIQNTKTKLESNCKIIMK